MKYFAVVAALATTCLAQTIAISAPAANSTVSAGQSITVQVDEPVRFTTVVMSVRLALTTTSTAYLGWVD